MLNAATDLRALAGEYGDAWNRQDLEAIVALHHPEGTFRLHVPGAETATGRDAIREAFTGVLAQLPDINFAEKSLLVGDGFWVLESTLSGTLEAPVEIEGEQVEAPGARVSVDCVDVIEVRDGLVARKETYLDGLAFQAALAAGAEAGTAA